ATTDTYTLSLHDALPIYLRRFRSFDLIKINQAEAQVALGSDDVAGAGDGLRRELGARVLVITLGSEGMLVFEDAAQPAHVAAVRSEEHTSELQSRGHLVC